jgi:P-type Ca2+ transporter type 2C
MGNTENFRKPHALGKEQFLQSIDTDPAKGLSQEEASRRLKKYGRNEMAEHEQRPLWKILLQQFLTPVMYLLAGAATLSFGFGDIPEGIAIAAVMIINAGIGFWMEFQARRSMQTLRKMDKMQARVIRDGKEKNIDAEEIVPGDAVLLESGALVPADLRLIEVSELQINESPLTGESVPVEKNTAAVAEDAQTGDRKNMAYKGTSVTRGKGKAIVSTSGINTEIGNVSEMVSSAGEEEIPLNKKLEKLSKNLI